jgi:2-keto-3-deoxy-L-rhamnonate aldolase RhmA
LRQFNKLKQLLKNGHNCIGAWSVIPSASVANILGASGFDFVIIDCEHGPATMETAEDMVRALESELCTPLIRVPYAHGPTILRAMEIGTHGIVVPQIETVEQARSVIDASKYSPLGYRGMSVFTRSSGYNAIGIDKRTEKENEETMVILIVEGEEGINSLDGICELEHIDVIYIGTYDLSQSLGVTDNVDSPKVINAVENCVKKIRNHGKAAGVLAQTEKDIEKWIDIGVQFIPYMVDCGIFLQACENIVYTFNKYKNN